MAKAPASMGTCDTNEWCLAGGASCSVGAGGSGDEVDGAGTIRWMTATYGTSKGASARVRVRVSADRGQVKKDGTSRRVRACFCK